jgi:raffinose/stachyose/melibiose transport system substrate-binding protein
VSEWTNPPAIAATKLLDKEFEKAYPGVHVRLVYAPTSGGEWTSMTNAEMAAHNVNVMAQFAIAGYSPKSYMTGLQPSTLEEWINAGEIKNLSGMSFLNKDFSPGIQQQMMGYKGKIWGVTLASYGRGGVFYNESMFKKYGLSVPHTWDQLIHVCQVLKSHGVTPFMVGAENGWDQMITEDGVQQEIPHSDASSLNKGLWTGKITWANDPVFSHIMSQYQTLEQYFEPNAFGEPYAPTPGLFADGKAAMLVDGTWDGYTIHQANPSLKFSWFPLPMTNNPSKDRMQVAGDFTWVIPTQNSHPRLSLDYVKFFAEPKHYLQWENMVGAIPTEPVSKLTMPWMSTELKFLPTRELEFRIYTPTNAGTLAYLPGDTAYLKPHGPYTVSQLVQKATQQWLAAVHH